LSGPEITDISDVAYDEASNDTNADAFTADKRPVGRR
jgi:hypothetical protein